VRICTALPQGAFLEDEEHIWGDSGSHQRASGSVSHEHRKIAKVRPTSQLFAVITKFAAMYERHKKVPMPGRFLLLDLLSAVIAHRGCSRHSKQGTGIAGQSDNALSTADGIGDVGQTATHREQGERCGEH
jgi:hypothetical protein